MSWLILQTINSDDNDNRDRRGRNSVCRLRR
jgi:hypothetical protein